MNDYKCARPDITENILGNTHLTSLKGQPQLFHFHASETKNLSHLITTFQNAKFLHTYIYIYVRKYVCQNSAAAAAKENEICLSLI